MLAWSRPWVVPLGMALALFVVMEMPFWFKSPKEISWLPFRRPGYLVADEVASYVSARTARDDPIYVAFAEAEIYYLADRRAAVPQLYWYELSASEKVFQQVTDSLRAREPAMVVWVNAPPASRMGVAEFRDLLEAGYAEDQRIGFVRVYRRRE